MFSHLMKKNRTGRTSFLQNDSEKRIVPKAYDTRCSQAVPHPSTILARRCLTAVIGREQVCSSWYGRRRPGIIFCPAHSSSSFSLHSTSIGSERPVALPRDSLSSQIKNIKLLIVTDIKVRIGSYSLSGFRFGWSRELSFKKKRTHRIALSCFVTYGKKIVPDVRTSF